MPRRRRHQAVADLAGQLWLVSDPDRLQAVLQEMHARATAPQGLAASGWEDDEDATPYELTAEGVAVIRLTGPMLPEVDWLTAWFGFVSTNAIRRALDRAAADGNVRSVFLVVDSPGGAVAGVRELHQAVAAFAKPLVVHVDGAMASAALWAACAAPRITASETALVGSIGTLWKVIDVSKMLATDGVKVEVVRSSPLKGAPVRGEALSAGARATLQAYVDDVAALFYADVRAARGLDDGAWEALGDPGQIWSAGRALGVGLIDATSTLDAALAAASAGDPKQGRPDNNDAPQAQEDTMDKETEARLAKLEAQAQEAAAAQKAAQEAAAALKAENEALRATMAAQQAEALKQRKDALLAEATAAGKIVPANKQALEALAATASEETLRAFLASAPVVVQPGGTALVDTREPVPVPDANLGPAEQADLRKIKAIFAGRALDAEGPEDDFSFVAHLAAGAAKA